MMHPEKESDRVAAVVLLRDDGSALLQHRDNKPGVKHPGKWTPPGGHCKPGEDLEVCARREFFEETRYRLADVYYLLDVVDESPGARPSHVRIYWSVYDGRQPIECHEGQGLEFVQRQDASSIAIPPYLARVWDNALAAFEQARVRRDA